MKTDLSRGWRTHAAVLAFGTFAVGTDGFVVAGILPEIARSLDVSVAAAGQLVTVFSIAYAVLAPVLATLTAGWSRRVVLPAGLALFAVGNVITALAPSYALVLVSRAVAAGGASLYAATASATAAAIAGDERRGRAIAIVMLGLTSSLALGAPLGTAVGRRSAGGPRCGWSRPWPWSWCRSSRSACPTWAAARPAAGGSGSPRSPTGGCSACSPPRSSRSPASTCRTRT
ncbi:MFS transporter, DHA1 family [[Actinomadura] parvosata subsp. kistnae]|uniref:MFS transporter n=1 Tax=[Actinomadura] parvosata TaxID=1955412 RepID=UPI000D27F06F|nr:MFS transporter, DHA1 family [Actinomadura parvosata subsp. kistnae]